MNFWQHLGVCPHLHWVNEQSILVDFGQVLKPQLSRVLAQVQQFILQEQRPCICQVSAGASSLLVEFDLQQMPPENAQQYIQQLLDQDWTLAPAQPRCWQIPVIYDGEDLPSVCQTLGLKQEDFIAQHLALRLEVMAVGFAPGFAYMGILPQYLQIPRRPSPRTRVKAGSLAMADKFCAIYPQDSPGGWHCLGHTPMQVFDWQNHPPGIFSLGDEITFIRHD